jgi:hypothetical protein
MVDFYGRIICIGDKIVYAGRKGSALWLTQATVQEILHDTIRVLPSYTLKPVTLKNMHTVALVSR